MEAGRQTKNSFIWGWTLRGGGNVISIDKIQGKSEAEIESVDYFSNAFHSLNDASYDWEIGRQKTPDHDVQRNEVRKMLIACIELLKPKERKLIECKLKGIISQMGDGAKG